MPEAGTSELRFGRFLVLAAFVLFSIFVVGLFWLTTNPIHGASITLAYATGLSMIVLPCTLPLVFIIVPLSIGRGYKKGFLMASLFGLGLTVTLTLYGIITALVGKFLGIDKATLIMFSVAGTAAYLFGLSELKLIGLRVPGLDIPVPQLIYRQKDYMKSLLMGLFLGNAGVGCPNPAFYVLMAYIATVGSVPLGGLLGFIHGVGRATPLIFLSIAGILGINATKGLTKRRLTIEKILGWSLIYLGAFIMLYGLLGMNWWEQGPFHDPWNAFIERVFGRSVAESEALEEQLGIQGWGILANALQLYDIRIHWAILITLFVVPIIWYKIKRRRGIVGD